MRTRWLVVITLLCTACDGIPRDAAGGLHRIVDGEVRVGASNNPPWISIADGQVGGLEAELIEGWAHALGARVVWRVGAVAELTEAVHRRELDVLAAGLDESTPHGKRVALTQSYLETTGRSGKQHRHVLAVTQGENALLLSLDRYLARQNEVSLLNRVAVAE